MICLLMANVIGCKRVPEIIRFIDKELESRDSWQGKYHIDNIR